MATQKTGYDCDFVDDPPSTLECSICLLTLREPHVITCCGNHFCRPCIERVQRDKKPCPLCNEPSYEVFLHKGVMREVNALKVRCPQKEQGCEWEGELGYIEKHLNFEAEPSDNSGCGYVEIECAQCGEKILRRDLEDHKLEQCKFRPIDAVIGSIMKRLDTLSAENREIKGENQQLKADLVAHKEEVAQLKACLATKEDIEQLNQSLASKAEAVQLEGMATREEITQLRYNLGEVSKSTDEVLKELETCKMETVEVKENLASLTPCPPVVFIMSNYEHYRNVDYTWISDPFYTHHGGYKMRVEVHPNGLGPGRGSYLTLSVHVIRGENDEKLQWPFHGDVTVQTYNREAKKWDKDYVVIFNESTPISCCSKPPADGISNVGWGPSKYIAHSDMKCFVANSGIRFRVIKIDQ